MIVLSNLQTYAPTTLAAPRDFWILRYTSGLEDGSLVVWISLTACYDSIILYDFGMFHQTTLDSI
jgi:hypothetical protein